MKDISMILKKALELADGYDAKLIAKQIEEISNVWCRLEDDSNLNWYLISKSDGNTVIKYYGYLSAKFPVALLMDECPSNIYKILYNQSILCESFYEKFSCSPEILSKYINVQEVELIDDSFLVDDNLPFDEELFLKIDDGINYINPYNFSFKDIK